jgi:general secretion pathway protein I
MRRFGGQHPGNISTSRLAPASKARSGLTLLEVVIALALFLFSLAALSHLMSLSSQNVVESNLRSQAGLMCQSKLAEVLSGAVSLDSTGYSAFDENPDWQWRLDCEPNEVVGLWNVQVWVKKDRANGAPFEVSLRQLVFSPSAKGSTLDPAPSASSSSAGGM